MGARTEFDGRWLINAHWQGTRDGGALPHLRASYIGEVHGRAPRRCVLASQVLQEAETCDLRLDALAAKLAAKIDERRAIALDEENQKRPLARRLPAVATVLSALNAAWALAAVWAFAAAVVIWYTPARKVEKWRNELAAVSWRKLRSKMNGSSSSSSAQSPTRVGGGSSPHQLRPPGVARSPTVTSPRSDSADCYNSADSPRRRLLRLSPRRVSHDEPAVPSESGAAESKGGVGSQGGAQAGVKSGAQGGAQAGAPHTLHAYASSSSYDPLVDTSLLEAAHRALAELAACDPTSADAELVCQQCAETLDHVQSELEAVDDFSGSSIVGGAAALAVERVRMLQALADAELGAEGSYLGGEEGSPSSAASGQETLSKQASKDGSDRPTSPDPLSGLADLLGADGKEGLGRDGLAADDGGSSSQTDSRPESRANGNGRDSRNTNASRPCSRSGYEGGSSVPGSISRDLNLLDHEEGPPSKGSTPPMEEHVEDGSAYGSRPPQQQQQQQQQQVPPHASDEPPPSVASARTRAAGFSGRPHAWGSGNGCACWAICGTFCE